jgi:glycosyltransferase involved in cell wall biosynthesis
MDYYRTASVFISLGSWEGQPTRLMEAMQFKTPVVAFAAGGTSDFVNNETNGLVIDKLDERLLASQLNRLLADKNLADRLGTAARNTIVANYNWEKIFERIFSAYQPLHVLKTASTYQ